MLALGVAHRYGVCRNHALVPEPGRETQAYVAFLDQVPVDEALAALAVAQHGVFALDQLCRLGLGAPAVRNRAASGRLHRIYRGVYSLVPRDLLKREGRWLAAVLACGSGAVLSHRTAAALHGLHRYDGVWIDVTVPTRSARAHQGIKLHRSVTLAPGDVTTIDMIPCTSVARTQLDLADVVNRRTLERALDQAEVIEAFELGALEHQLARNRHRAGARHVRAVLDEHYVGSTTTWSDLEEAFLALTRGAGLPRPEVNSWILLPDRGPAIRADFKWESHRVVVETDGHRWHDTRRRRELDADRDQRLTVAGWRPMRVTWRQIMTAADVVAGRVAALLGV
jgi:predicted transcriptional regulator of viral defense system